MPIRISEAPRGVLAGIKKDAELAKQARLTGEETRAHGVAWSHGYLNQKPWHPLSYRNQRDLFMAEEKTAKAAETNKQAQFEFEREQEFFRNAELMGDRERERVTNRQSVSFMYQKPPGYEAMIEKEKENLAAKKKEEQKAAALLTRQGVEEAAEEPAPRKKMLRDRYGNLVATAEMFPALKDAPKHESASDTAHATPFGVEIRMIQCKRCKQWGHNGTDRECPMRDQNPNDEFRQRLEDPLNLMKARSALAKEDKLKMKYIPGNSPLRGGGDRSQENQQILGPSDDDDDHDGNPHTGNILDQLPKKERKRLLKDYIRNERQEKKTARRAKRAAAEAFLQQAGVRTESSKRAKRDRREKEEEKEKERSSKKSKESSKSKHKKHRKKKSKKNRKAETSSDSSSSSGSSDSSDGSDSD